MATEAQKATDALQRAALLGLIDPFAQAVKSNWPNKGFLLEGRYGTWRAYGDLVTLNMRHVDCGELDVQPSGHWCWGYSNTTSRPIYSYYRDYGGRTTERHMQGKAGPLPNDLFNRTWVRLRNALADYTKATKLALPPVYISVLFPTG